MGIITQLSEHLSNMIAAGEVVERPQGIVKELVENAIDANATQITIQIEQGGIEKITIVDNGDGMNYEDARAAFERHATSKIKNEDDLWHIGTMGFRGEALPSIAAVAKVILETSDGDSATLVEIAYGKEEQYRKSARPKGTSIEVIHLFQKTPARFKHLKSFQYEFSLIQDVIQKFAFAYPSIRFTLEHNQKEVFASSGQGDLREVLYQVYGADVAKDAIQISANDVDYKVDGYIAQPSYNRATKYHMLFFINHRMVRSYRLQKAILDAYSDYMPKERAPITVLDITMDTHLVDVNVHPSKWEIRLSKEKQLENLIYRSISDALKESMNVVSFKMPKEKVAVEEQTLDFTYNNNNDLKGLAKDVNETFDKEQPSLDFEEIQKEVDKLQEERTLTKDLPAEDTQEIAHIEKREVFEPVYKKTEEVETVKEAESKYQSDEKEFVAVKEETIEIPNNPSFPHMEVIGQFHGNYILAQGDEGLYIVDQHAAQEKYHFELIRRKIFEGVSTKQPLLLPIVLDVQPKVVAVLQELNAHMEPLHITFEEFSGESLVVRELPIWMQGVDEKQVLLDMVDFFMQDQAVDTKQIRKKAIATMACHSSIRFNRTLNKAEMQQVIEDLKMCEQPFHCPHGRPTFILIKDKDLFVQFERA